jgi:signal peptidase I
VAHSTSGTKLPPAMLPRRTPRPWLAALLSLVQAGLGHVYAGSVARGVAIAVATLFGGSLLMLAIVVLPGRSALAAVPVAILVILVLIPLDAWRQAARRRASERARSPELWIAILVFFVLHFFAATTSQWWLRTHLIEPFRIPSPAMEPTMLPGDWIFTVPRRGEALRDDELAVFRSADMMLIKRIVALPGETIAMRKTQLLRNGRPVAEPWVMMQDTIDRADSEFVWGTRLLTNPSSGTTDPPTLDNWGPLVVPAGNVFVLGDNRHNSRDSRYLGFIPIDSIIKLPTEVYFSFDPDTRSVRWNRIGRRVE